MLNDVTVASEIFQKFPHYCVSLLEVTGVCGGDSNEFSEKLLLAAENQTRELLSSTSLEDLAEVKMWREAFETFGVKPRVARSSFEALLRRAEKGLPRVDVLTDIYNAVSVMHRIPIGGENLEAYVGAAHLTFATGDESFDARENGELVVQHPEPGEVIWRDDVGVTCRRWNWRQCVRTRLEVDTSSVLFIFDGLGESAVVNTKQAADHLCTELSSHWPDAVIHTRTISG